MKVGTRVIVNGVGAGNVVENRGAYVLVEITGHAAPYLARVENCTALATPMGKGEIETPTPSRLMGARA